MLLLAFQAKGYVFLTFENYCTAEHLPDRYVILRHDVDRCPQNSVATAQIENKLQARASYYFRVVPESNQPDAIRRIADLGHEIGYHYEDMALAHGDIDKAFAHFEKSLHYFRTYYPVRTVCMHGAPTSRYDGRNLWEKYDYRKSGILGEPYFDVDFSQCYTSRIRGVVGTDIRSPCGIRYPFTRTSGCAKVSLGIPRTI